MVLKGGFVIPLGLILASFVNSFGRTRIQSVFRVGFFIPNVISTISIVLVFKYVLLKNGGLLNSFLSLFSSTPVTIGWLTDSSINKIGATIMSVWHGLGYSMLICLAGLQSIPKELYEAAEIDRANALQRWRYITLPNMVSILVFLLITNTISGFSRFGDFFVIGFNSSSGGSRAALQTLLMYIYQYSFDSPQYGLSSAGAMILFVIVFIVTMINMKLTRVFDH